MFIRTFPLLIGCLVEFQKIQFTCNLFFFRNSVNHMHRQCHTNNKNKQQKKANHRKINKKKL